MRNLLLNANPIEDLIPFIVLGAFLLIAIIAFIIIKKLTNPNSKKAKENIGEIDKNKSMQMKIPFLNSAENSFLTNFYRVLPDEYVVYPKITMEQLILPYNNLNFYNAVKYKTLDYVVFLRKNMQPVVVLDLHDRTGAQKSIEEDDKLLFDALNNVKIPIVTYEVRQDYEPAEILGRFLDALDPLAIANLKKNRQQI